MKEFLQGAVMIFIVTPALAENADTSQDKDIQLCALTNENLGIDNIEESSNIRVATTCFFEGSRTSGMSKICYYDCLGDTVAITIDSTDLCPQTINR